MYECHEQLKKTECNARIIEVEKGTFTPLVFSCTGGVSPETERFLKLLSKKISEKKQEQYSHVVACLRRRFRFDLLRSCIVSLRGERSSSKSGKVSALEYGLRREASEGRY